MGIRGGDVQMRRDIKPAREVINKFQNLSGIEIVAITDDTDFAREIVGTSVNLMEYRVGQEYVYRDFKIMLNAIGILVVRFCGWSTLSGLASILRRIPLIQTSHSMSCRYQILSDDSAMK